MTAQGPDDVPFAGLRRNAVALAAGIVIVVALFVVVPDIAPRPSGLPPVQLVHGRIVELIPTRRLPFIGEGSGVRHAPGWD